MHHSPYTVFVDGPCDEGSVQDASLHQADIWHADAVAGREVVQDDHVLTGLHHGSHHVGSDVVGTTGDQPGH